MMKISPTKYAYEGDHGTMILVDTHNGTCMELREEELQKLNDACAALLHDFDQAREAIAWETESDDA